MKLKTLNIFLFLLLLISFSAFILGCDSPTNSKSLDETSDNSEDSTDLWGDSPDVASNLELNASAANPGVSYSKGISRAATTTNKIYFRSSDIEFWAIDSVADINNIFSNKYQQWNEVDAALGFADGRSLEYKLGNMTESVAFTPYNNYSTTLGEGLNDTWSTLTSDFMSAGLSKINLARLDIGNGNVTFIIDGEERQVFKAGQQEESCPYTLQDLENAVSAGYIIQDSAEYNYYYNAITTGRGYYGPFGSGIEANSIFFVDKAFLSKPVMVEGSAQNDLINNVTTASDLGITASEFEVVQTIIANKNEVDIDTMIDVDGALFLPLDPVDLSSFNPSANTLQIEIGWNIAKAIHKAGDTYFMDNRVKNTAFNFSVAITIQ